MARYFSASVVLLASSLLVAAGIVGAALLPAEAETHVHHREHKTLGNVLDHHGIAVNNLNALDGNQAQEQERSLYSSVHSTHKCLGSVLPPDSILRPNEYICAYDPDDGSKIRFGLNFIGILLFYRDDKVIWSAKKRGDYLTFAGADSHLVLYSHGGNRVAWSTQCFGRGRGKAVEINLNGAKTKPGLLLVDENDDDVWFLGTDGMLAGCYPDPKLLEPPPPTEKPTGSPTVSPTAYPTEVPTAEPTEIPTASPVEAEVEEDEAPPPAQPMIGNPTPIEVECDRLRGTATLLDNPYLTFKFNIKTPYANQRNAFTADQRAAGGILNVHLIYMGEGYIAVGPSRFGGMVGSEAVLCVPETGDRESDVAKYFLNGVHREGEVTELLPMKKQSLIDASIEQKNGITKCSFTKLLREEGEIPINPYGRNIFVWAVGDENDASYHAQGSVVVDFGKCFPDGVPEEFAFDAVEDVIEELQEEEDEEDEDEEDEVIATLPRITLEPTTNMPTTAPTIGPSKSPVVPVTADAQMTNAPTMTVTAKTTGVATAVNLDATEETADAATEVNVDSTEETTDAATEVNMDATADTPTNTPTEFIPPPASNDPGLTQIYLIGDAPFNDKEMTYWVPKQVDMVPYDADFLFHVGNQMRPAASNCNIWWNKFMRNTALGKSPVPVFITPGENDYVQCRGKIEDSDNDVELAWQNWKDTYLHLDQRWKHNLPVVYQEGREENFSILIKKTLITSVHMINGPVLDEQEWTDRHLDNYNFVKERLDAHAGDFDVVVLLSHAKPEDIHQDFWSRLTFLFVTDPVLKKTPFVYVHGGGNGIYEEEDRFLNLKNFLRIQIEGRKRNPINLMIDTTSASPVKIDRNDKSVWSVCCNPWLNGWPNEPL